MTPNAGRPTCSVASGQSCVVAWTIHEGIVRPAATGAIARAALDSRRARWQEAPSRRCLSSNENLLDALLHLVERPDLRHPAVDVALWRAGRRGRARQPLLSHPRRQDRPGAALRAALGDLWRLC